VGRAPGFDKLSPPSRTLSPSQGTGPRQAQPAFPHSELLHAQSFCSGANLRASRFIPAEPKSTSALALSPAPEVATTVPSPKVGWSTFSPGARVGISRSVGRGRGVG